MAKKIFGILFIAVSILFSLSILLQIPDTLHTITSLFSVDNTASELGVLTGQLMSTVIFIILVILLFRLGVKWVKTPKHPN